MYLAPSVTTIDVPDGFLEPATAYDWEMLAIERSGNQTLASGFFPPWQSGSRRVVRFHRHPRWQLHGRPGHRRRRVDVSGYDEVQLTLDDELSAAR